MNKVYLIKCASQEDVNDNFNYMVISCCQYGAVNKKENSIQFSPYGKFIFVDRIPEDVKYDGILGAEEFDRLVSDLYEVENDQEYFISSLMIRVANFAWKIDKRGKQNGCKNV